MPDSVARHLRNTLTDAERKLWHALRLRQLGAKFRRQQRIGACIVDFVCLERRLVIEVDGGQHGGEDDHARDVFLKKEGFTVLRFWNHEVPGNLGGVLTRITEVLRHHPHPNPPPSRGRE